MPKTTKRKRKLLCKDCKRRQKRGQLIGTMILTQCRECGRDTNGEERAYCAGCAETFRRCTWCGGERDD